MEYQYLKNIKKGMKVIILTNQKRYSTGIIDDIAVRKPFNEEGIMVRLKNGDIGRVKEIILSEPEQNEKSTKDIKLMIEKGENLHTEFKAEALWSLNYNPKQIKEAKSFELREYGQKASKIIIAKSIAALLNSDGGNLILGVKEKKERGEFEIIGIEEDMKKTKDPGIDSYRRIIIDEIIKTFFPSRIFNHLDNYISFEFVNIEGKTILWIKLKKSDSKVFLKINNKEIFIIRVDSENRTLEGEKLVDYCIRNWGYK